VIPLVPHCAACTALVPANSLDADPSHPEVAPYYCGYCASPYFEGPYADLCGRCADAEDGLTEQATLITSTEVDP